MKNLKKKINIWKTIAIIFIILFVLILIGGLFNAHRFRSPDMRATDSEIENAKNIALNDLKDRGEDITNFLFRSSDMIRGIDKESLYKKTLEVSLYNQSVRYSYIINIDSNVILVYSKTIFADGVDHSRDMVRGFPGPFRK